jgi:UDP-N-acetylmuramoylalanine--D-glutamate ligase
VTDAAALKGRRVTVVGLGDSGFAAAHALIRFGAVVRVTESGSTPEMEKRASTLRAAGAEVEIGGHDLSWVTADIAVVSPGVPPNAPVINALRECGAEIIGEIELAFRLSSCDFLAVTGTNGKTTTTSLLATMLQEGGFKSCPAGNIGWPLIEAIDSVPDDGAIVVEVSSFQLESTKSFRPTVAVLLNISDDHLDWHGSFDNYARAKARIVMNQGPEDLFVYNVDDAIATRIAGSAPSTTVPFSGRHPVDGGVGVDRNRLVYRGRDLMAVARMPLRGIPGRENTAAAASAALGYGVDAEAVVRAIEAFQPLRHRLEIVGDLGGVTFIDDSKATNPHATLAAVQGLTDVVLIAGGRSKGIDLRPLASTVPPVRAVIVMGEAGAEIEAIFSGRIPVARAASMAEAVPMAHSQSVSGGSVLLSPGCASLDMFESYAARGDAFARAVAKLMEGEP